MKMKSFLSVALLVPTLSFAAIQGSPFQPEVDSRFDKIEQLSNDGIQYAHVARATYSVAASGGAVGSYSMGVSLPANAMITSGHVYFKSQFVDSGSGTLALKCEDAGNILTAVDVTGNAAGSVININQNTSYFPNGISSNIAAQCDLTAVVAGTTLTSGTLVLFLDYVVTP